MIGQPPVAMKIPISEPTACVMFTRAEYVRASVLTTTSASSWEITSVKNSITPTMFAAIGQWECLTLESGQFGHWWWVSIVHWGSGRVGVFRKCRPGFSSSTRNSLESPSEKSNRYLIQKIFSSTAKIWRRRSLFVKQNRPLGENIHPAVSGGGFRRDGKRGLIGGEESG